jgi:hypothetical protein
MKRARLPQAILLGGLGVLGTCDRADPLNVNTINAEWIAADCRLAVRCGAMPDEATCLRGSSGYYLQAPIEAVPAAARGSTRARPGNAWSSGRLSRSTTRSRFWGLGQAHSLGSTLTPSPRSSRS